MIVRKDGEVAQSGLSTALQYSRWDFGDFSTSSKTRASKTLAAVIVIELRESCMDDRSFSRNTTLSYEVSSHENRIVRGAAAIVSIVNEGHDYYSKPRTFAA